MTTTTEAPDRVLYSPREAAKLLGVSERFLFDLTKRGELPSFKLGRLVKYSRATLEAWAAARLQSGDAR